MASRGHFPPGYGGRPEQAQGMMRHGPFSIANHRALETLPPELLDNRLLVQKAEIKRLAGDNHRLASSEVALRHELVATQQDIHRLKALIRSPRIEADIKIRDLLEKFAKFEAEGYARESSEELQQARLEAQGLLKINQELSVQIQQASQEFEIARADIKRITEMQTELESVKNEHQRLHTTFEYEKGWNMEKVEKLKFKEKELIAKSRDRENLRAQVENAERRARVPNPYGAPYIQGAGGYVDNYSRSMQTSISVSGEMMGPYGFGSATATNNVGGAAFPGSAGGAFNRSRMV